MGVISKRGEKINFELICHGKGRITSGSQQNSTRKSKKKNPEKTQKKERKRQFDSKGKKKLMEREMKY